MPTQPVTQLTLDASIPAKALEDIRDNFSAICFAAGHLWLGGDEGTSIDRLTEQPGGGFAKHRRFDLAPLLDLPAAGEIDIEGLDFDGGYLWVVGSHSIKRSKAGKDNSDSENRERLATVKAEANRHVLARIALNAAGEPVAQEGPPVSARSYRIPLIQGYSLKRISQVPYTSRHNTTGPLNKQKTGRLMRPTVGGEHALGSEHTGLVIPNLRRHI